jgi:hypothetical protein
LFKENVMDDETTDYEQIEKMTEQWEKVGLFPDHPDQANLVLCIRTQAKVAEFDVVLQAISIPALVRCLRDQPTKLVGVLETNGLSDVYPLCDWDDPVEDVPARDTEIFHKIVEGISEKVPDGTMFGGIVKKNEKLYLVGGS